MSKFKIFKYELNTKKLPENFEGFTFVMLADLHNKTYGPDNEQLLAAIEAQNPDAILVAGDMLVASPEQSFAPAQQLLLRLREKGYPIFYGNGNHEHRMRMQPQIYKDMYEAYMTPLKESGIQVLENEKAFYEKNGQKLAIYGFELDQKYYKKLGQVKFRQKDLSDALGKSEEVCYNILLAHNPVYFDAYAKWGADLTLSGHLHGGIIRLPLIGGVITPQARLFPKYDAGRFSKNGRELIVSRGLGTHTVNIRFLNPAELGVIHLKGAEAGK